MIATNEEIIQAYKDTGSVWRAAMRLGMCGQSVHERLQRLGHKLYSQAWSADEIAVATKLYSDGFSISRIAQRLGRPYAGIACKLSELKVKSAYKTPRKIKRGLGLTKPKVIAFARYLLASNLPITRAAKQRQISTTSLVNALQTHAPELWAAYVAKGSTYAPRICEACGREFTPLNARQKCCDGKCSATARADKKYFGGNRRNTIGLAEGVCQLCQRKAVRALSSHHVYGKENDPENEVLIALCPGCHQLVGVLGKRTAAMDPEFWENLISLVVLRHSADKGRKLTGTNVSVEIEGLDEEEVSELQSSGYMAPPVDYADSFHPVGK